MCPCQLSCTQVKYKARDQEKELGWKEDWLRLPVKGMCRYQSTKQGTKDSTLWRNWLSKV